MYISFLYFHKESPRAHLYMLFGQILYIVA